MMRKLVVKRTLVTVAALLTLSTASQASDLVDPNLKPYQPVSGVSGNIKSIGSDSMNNTMTLWAEGFLGQYPNVQIEIEGKGSGTAPPA
jgi:phosphate transport system substrate-binding protein